MQNEINYILFVILSGIIAMGFDIRVRQYWELLKILKMFTIPGSVVAKLKFIENGVLNVKLNIFHKAVLQPT